MPSMRRTQKLGPQTLEKLAALYPEGGQIEGGVAKLAYLSRSSDSTTKLLLTLADGLQVESVIIPWKGQRSTLCVSSQVGCKQGCRFCATGKMGKIRSLTSTEILAQLYFAKKIIRLNGLPEITNIVFMGMGDAGKFCGRTIMESIFCLDEPRSDLPHLIILQLTMSSMLSTLQK